MLRAVFEHAPIGITLTDTWSRRVLAANPRFAEIAGREIDDVIGVDWVDFNHPDDAAADLALESIAATPWYRMPKRYVRPDGSLVWVEMSVTPLEPVDGRARHLCMIDDISDRHAAEQRLAQLVEILESSPDYVATADADGVITWGNAALRALAGVADQDELIERPRRLLSLFTPESRQRFLTDAVPALFSTGVWVGEIEGRYPDGTGFPLSFSAIAHFDETGYPHHFSGIARDIAEAKHTAQALADSERRMRTLVDSAPMGIFETNPWGACTYVNPAFCAITRIADPSHALGFGWGRVLHPDDAAAVGAKWAVAIRTGVPFVGQFRFVTPAGDTVWADIEAVPVAGDDGTTELFLGTVTDITERLALERAQFEAAELFRTAFDDAPTGMVLTDVSADRVTLLKCNASYARMMGIDAADIGRLNLLDITHPDDLAAVSENRRRLLDGEIDRDQMEVRAVRPDGSSIWTLLTRSLIRDADGRPRYVISQVTDITAEKETRQQIEHFAFTDPLTGLPNRRSFLDRLEQTCAARREGDARVALLFIDLDHFKTINDRLGHDAGDDLLRDVARTLLAALRSHDLVARLGGDEFAIIVSGVGDMEMRMIADRLRRQLQFPRTLPDGEVVTVTASIGLAWASADESVDEFLRRADVLMYEAKRAGRDRLAEERRA
ncbi:MAG: PAS domain S-box protein [Acidimicrobiales bacterium]|nr:PAS domain S-box protein [Acidimicrobiales bacterium]MCB9395594.1 PAS domain S-box protein [Acidimicrobiaceae bacterium]